MDAEVGRRKGGSRSSSWSKAIENQEERGRERWTLRTNKIYIDFKINDDCILIFKMEKNI